MVAMMYARELKIKDKWLEGLMSQPLFQFIPVEHQRALIENLEVCPIREGISPIVEGDKADYVYVVKKGSFKVERVRADTGESYCVLLQSGQWFGEEAAITGNTRNAHVTALENSICYRVSRVFFVKHIVAPMIKRVKANEARKWIKAGARVLDIGSSEVYVREKDEFSTNLPLHRLHHVVGRLKKDKKYLIKSNRGAESLVSVFVLLDPT